MVTAGKKQKQLVGSCGLHCGICTLYRAYHDQNLSLWQETPKNFREHLGFQIKGRSGSVKGLSNIQE